MEAIKEKKNNSKGAQGEDSANAIFFFGDFSPLSKVSLKKIEKIARDEKLQVQFVNVSENKTVHQAYKIDKVPALVILKKQQPVNWIFGDHHESYFKSALLEHTAHSRSKNGSQRTFNIQVYTTPTCHFCTKIKNHLRKKGFTFREIDISRNASVAEKLVQKTGQTGVPQTSINGQWIIGFDQKKIDTMLGIEA
jgi:glutaredoxin-like YruB-family protein